MGFKLRNVKGDGNCGLYASLLSLKQIGKVPDDIFQNDDSIAGATIALRKSLKDFLQTNGKKIWDSLPKTKEGSLPMDVDVFADYDPKFFSESVGRLFNPEISVNQYFHDIEQVSTEHITDFGLIALVSMFNTSLSIVQRDLVGNYFTHVIDGSKFKTTSKLQYYRLPGVRQVSDSDFDNKHMELFTDGGHFQYLSRNNRTIQLVERQSLPQLHVAVEEKNEPTPSESIMALCQKAIGDTDLNSIPQSEGMTAILEELYKGLSTYENSEFRDGRNCCLWISRCLEHEEILHYDSKSKTIVINNKALNKPQSDLPSPEEVGEDYENILQTTVGPLLYEILLNVGDATASSPLDDRKMPAQGKPSATALLQDKSSTPTNPDSPSNKEKSPPKDPPTPKSPAAPLNNNPSPSAGKNNEPGSSNQPTTTPPNCKYYQPQ